jgi:adenosylcobinamide kinase/adenosylcobinamide-phosphate guanylyltransferase
VPLSHLILGGARSGKSRFAIQGWSPSARRVLVATAEAGDADMVARIARHRDERGRDWRTIEEPRALAACLASLAGRADVVVVDCLTLWVANRLLLGDADDAILGEAQGVAAIAGRHLYDLALVSNEVGEGVHPPTEDGRRFRDLLGLVNQAVAAACDRVTLMVAGLPLSVKRESPASADAIGSARAHEAP